MQPPGPDAARYVHVSDDYEAVLAAWTRLGFEPVPGWSRGLRSTLFRAGPSLVELVDGAGLAELASVTGELVGLDVRDAGHLVAGERVPSVA